MSKVNTFSPESVLLFFKKKKKKERTKQGRVPNKLSNSETSFSKIVLVL